VILRCFSGAQESVLLALFDPGIPGEQAGAFQRWLEFPVEFNQGPGDPEPGGFSLSPETAPPDAHEDVKFVLCLGQPERLPDKVFMGIETKIFREGAGLFVHDQRDVAFPERKKTLATDDFRLPVP